MIFKLFRTLCGFNGNEAMKNYNALSRSYDDWMEAVDQAVMREVGLSVHDLADGMSRDAWIDEVDPIDYARDLLAAEGWQG